MAFVPPARHLLRARDLADPRYFEPLGVEDLARAAGLSRAHFSREFRRTFGESPHAYLLTRRLERAAALLRSTDNSVGRGRMLTARCGDLLDQLAGLGGPAAHGSLGRSRVAGAAARGDHGAGSASARAMTALAKAAP
jgi:AraC-like DNA-binding protein